jgi:hypothetical protein
LIILSTGPPADGQYCSVCWTASGDVVYRQPGKDVIYKTFDDQLEFDKYLIDHRIKIRLWPVTEVDGGDIK